MQADEDLLLLNDMALQRDRRNMLEKFEIVVDHYTNGRTGREIAAERHMHPATINTILHRDLVRVVDFHR